MRWYEAAIHPYSTAVIATKNAIENANRGYYITYETVQFYLTNHSGGYMTKILNTTSEFDISYYVKKSNPTLKWVLVFLNEPSYTWLNIDYTKANFIYDFMKEHLNKFTYVITSEEFDRNQEAKEMVQNGVSNMASLDIKEKIPMSNKAILLAST